MDFMHDEFFTYALLVLVPSLVWCEHTLLTRFGIVWGKVNQPSLAVLNGGLCGVIYRASYHALNSVPIPPELTIAAAFKFGVLAGLASSGVRSLAKDMHDGSFKSRTAADVGELRAPDETKPVTPNDVGA